MSHSPLINVDEDLAAIAVEAGLLPLGEPITGQMLAYGYEVIAACARIGDRHGDDGNNAGDHIRSVFFPHPDGEHTGG
jgi:hypothetical protein